ncbi:MAG TPA: helix-turn-helix transcriptional regulator [Candidatus Baltobacteraceae bacterium]|nr:helix-turn-helix transcriptional regulator [Candidatus Baltobacteraceae bacterium]
MALPNPIARLNEALRINLVVLRARAGLSQAALAKRSGVSRAIISELEQGRGDVRLTTLARVAQALGATVNELLEPWHPRPPTEDELARRAREDDFIDAETLLAAMDERTTTPRYSRRGRRPANPGAVR